MISSNEQKSLEKLHARLVDTLNGYHEALKRTNDPALRVFLEGFAALRKQHIDQLAQRLAAKGIEPQSEGGWMTVVHESIMKVRDTFGTLDKSARDDILKGEESILNLYDTTLDDLSGNDDITRALVQQRDELELRQVTAQARL